jgi:glycine/D-amino acid oxidase-like deaminating enzyme
MTPDTLGEIYEYGPSTTELWVAAGIFSIGFLAFTWMAKVAMAILLGDLHASRATTRRDAPSTRRDSLTETTA